MLNDTKIKAAKPRENPYKLFDGGGLYLLIARQADGKASRWWRLKYRFNGKEKVLALGVYPAVGLKMARAAAADARKALLCRVDPSVEKAAARVVQSDTLRAVAEEWLGMQSKTLAAVTVDKARWMLDTFIFPKLGDKQINDIRAPELLAALRRIEAKGRHETATRAKQRVGQIMRYAIATGRAERDITQDLRGALAPVPTKNRPALTDPVRVGELLRAVDGYQGEATTAAALKLAPLTFVRPGELRAAEWREFDLDGADPQWRIPGERMKMGTPHIVPLARQAVEILTALREVSHSTKYLFPSLRTRDRPMSENTLNAALRRLGYTSDQMTAHGFRAMASTLLNEQGFPPDVIELQLAHKERNKVRAAYNRAERLAERRKLMQAWADYLDGLRAGGNVVTLRGRKGAA